MRVETIAIIGSGLMGRGIAHAAAAGGYRTILYDVSAEALDRARRQIRADLDEGVRRGKLAAADAEAAFARLRVEEDLGRAVAEAAFVIEAVPEQIELKLQVFARLDERCPAGAVLASNTSSLSVTEIAAATRRPQQVVGMHFFNPVPKMKLGLNHPMGPFELVDLVGLDTRLSVLEFLHGTLGEKYRPAPLLVQHVKAGRLGKKVGRGVYDYAQERVPAIREDTLLK
jgi:3-hydroxyacyl-CoA dehydrogenase